MHNIAEEPSPRHSHVFLLSCSSVRAVRGMLTASSPQQQLVSLRDTTIGEYKVVVDENKHLKLG